MKPRVFLSHSKADRSFVEKLANDLRAARVDVWYDEWEIPAGVSFRRKIFEEGIPESDLFFVYLSVASTGSYWVQRELDAAFVLDAQAKGGSMALFADSENTRRQLSSDIQALHCPVLNTVDYDRGLWHLIGRAWEAAAGRRIEGARQDANRDILRLEKDLADLHAKLTRLESAGSAGIDTTIKRLEGVSFEVKDIPGRSFTLLDLFRALAGTLAIGTSFAHLNHRLKRHMVPDIEVNWQTSLQDLTGNQGSEIIGPLIISRLVKVHPPVGEHDELYYLTELGSLVAEKLTLT